MLKVVARFPEETGALESALPLVEVRDLWPEIFLGGAFFGLGHAATCLVETWPQSRRLLGDAPRLASYYAAVRGSGRGSVRPAWIGAGAVLSYELSERDLQGLSRGLAQLGELLLAAGALEVVPAVRGAGAVRTPEQARRWRDETLPRRGLGLTTVHAFSSCPSGEDRARCAVDSGGRVFGTENLFACDASILPDSPGMNPQGSVMALAHRNATRFARDPISLGEDDGRSPS